MDSGRTRKFEWTPSQFLHCHLREYEYRGKRVTKQDIDEFGGSVGCPVPTQSNTTKGPEPIQIVAECELKNVSASPRTEQKDWIQEMRSMRR